VDILIEDLSLVLSNRKFQGATNSYTSNLWSSNLCTNC